LIYEHIMTMNIISVVIIVVIITNIVVSQKALNSGVYIVRHFIGNQ